MSTGNHPCCLGVEISRSTSTRTRSARINPNPQIISFRNDVYDFLRLIIDSDEGC